jgi:predicted secreted protein
MGAITGKSGFVQYNSGTVVRVNSWSMDIDNGVYDVTSFSTSTVQWREYVGGLSGWTGSIDATFDPTSTGIDDLIADTMTASTGTVNLVMDKTNGGSFSGGAVLNTMSVGADIDGPTTISWSVTGNGALTYSTST